MIYKNVQLNTAGTASLECFVLDSQINTFYAKTRPAIIVCPGGAYEKVSHREGEPVAMRFLGMGYQVFVLHYPVLVVGPPSQPGRLPKTDPRALYPEPLYALMRAMAYVHAHASDWDINEERIYAMGFSAGGHVVGSLAEHWDDPALLERGSMRADETRPRGILLCYPMVTVNLGKDRIAAAEAVKGSSSAEERDKYGLTPKQAAELQLQAVFGSKIPGEEDYDALDLRKHIRSDMPRTFVWQTATDDLLRAYETSEFVTTLMKAGVPCEFHLFQCGQHGMALADKTTSATPGDVNPAASNWVALAQTWLDRDGSPINHAL